MPPYTRVRIEEAPNLAELFRIPPEKFELRILRDVLGCESIGVSYERFGAGWKNTVGHRHPAGEEEVYVLVSGRAQIKIEDEVVELEPLTALRVAPEATRAIRALGDEDAVFVAVGAGKSQLDSTEFVRDFWPA